MFSTYIHMVWILPQRNKPPLTPTPFRVLFVLMAPDVRKSFVCGSLWAGWTNLCFVMWEVTLGGRMIGSNIFCAGVSTKVWLAVNPFEDTPTNKIYRRAPRAAHEQNGITNKIVYYLSRSSPDLVLGLPLARDGRSCSWAWLRKGLSLVLYNHFIYFRSNQKMVDSYDESKFCRLKVFFQLMRVGLFSRKERERERERKTHRTTVSTEARERDSWSRET